MQKITKEGIGQAGQTVIRRAERDRVACAKTCEGAFVCAQTLHSVTNATEGFLAALRAVSEGAARVVFLRLKNRNNNMCQIAS